MSLPWVVWKNVNHCGVIGGCSSFPGITIPNLSIQYTPEYGYEGQTGVLINQGGSTSQSEVAYHYIWDCFLGMVPGSYPLVRDFEGLGEGYAQNLHHIYIPPPISKISVTLYCESIFKFSALGAAHWGVNHVLHIVPRPPTRTSSGTLPPKSSQTSIVCQMCPVSLANGIKFCFKAE